MTSELNAAIKLREEGHLAEANAMLSALLKTYPDDADINYQYAWCCDAMGLEKEAVPYYEKAIALGLSQSDLQEAYLGLGSTYRTIGEYGKSKAIFQEGIEKFDCNVYRVFLAMTLFNLEEHKEAMSLLFRVIIDTSQDEGIERYRKAISYYSDKLSMKW